MSSLRRGKPLVLVCWNLPDFKRNSVRRSLGFYVGLLWKNSGLCDRLQTVLCWFFFVLHQENRELLKCLNSLALDN